ncbi:putative choline sulfatase [Paenibacillus algicola]|uniref:Putative choline sulfatase n=1 Tax=Paenibacillus algicola TaxID=2565926 RepID=A0A4P8XH47_9BACL|nr:putative choline sulfatase [Paenibacillus algicola]
MSLPKRPMNGEELLTYWNRFQNRYKYRDQGVDDHLMRTMKAA